jgi:Protein of unknown function (DUF2637)
VAVVAAVAATAGWVSYQHALDVVRLAGEHGDVAYAYPVFIDGLVYMSSMVLLSAARRTVDAPRLAWGSLGVGIALTLAANVYEGSVHGVLGGLAGALPAVALVLSYELLMWLIRRPKQAPVTETASPVPAPVPAPPAAELNGTGHEAMELFAAELAAGTVPGIRKIREQMHLGSGKATMVRDFLATQVGRIENPN